MDDGDRDDGHVPSDLLGGSERESQHPLILTKDELQAEDEEVLRDPSRFAKRMLSKRVGNPKFEKDKFEISRRVLMWILRNDFPLPRIQFMFYDTCALPTKEETEAMKKENPNYRSGNFDELEDALIIQRFQILVRANHLNAKQAWQLVKEMMVKRKTERGARRLYNTKMIVGAYVGRPMLQYRRIMDIFLRLLRLTRMKNSKDMEIGEDLKQQMFEYLDKNGNHYAACLKHFDVSDRLAGYQLRHMYQYQLKLKARETYKQGRFSPKEEKKILRLLLSAQQVSSILQVRDSIIDWNSLATKTNRSAISLYRHYARRMKPILVKYESDEEYLYDPETEKAVLKFLLQEGYTRLVDIDYSKLLKLAPHETKESLQEKIGKNIRIRKQDAEDLFPNKEIHEMTFGDKVQAALQRLNRKELRHGATKNSLTTARKLVKKYKKVKRRLEAEKHEPEPDRDSDPKYEACEEEEGMEQHH